MWWFVILLEFDFIVAIKKVSTHSQSNHVSCLTNGEIPIGVNDDLPDVMLFQVEMVPKWSEHVVHLLSTTVLTLGESVEEKVDSMFACS